MSSNSLVKYLFGDGIVLDYRPKVINRFQAILNEVFISQNLLSNYLTEV